MASCYRVAAIRSATRSCSSFARVLAGPEVQAALSVPPATSRPAGCLPVNSLPSVIDQKLDTWTAAALTTANTAATGKQAYSLSVPLLIASQRGRVDEAAPLAARMCLALEQESADRQVDETMRAWMLGRLLLASNQMGDSMGAEAFEKQLETVQHPILRCADWLRRCWMDWRRHGGLTHTRHRWKPGGGPTCSCTLVATGDMT